MPFEVLIMVWVENPSSMPIKPIRKPALIGQTLPCKVKEVEILAKRCNCKVYSSLLQPTSVKELRLMRHSGLFSVTTWIKTVIEYAYTPT
jgi:hypothetical protein